jgi:uncharacterized delta-60 repeat protein
MQVIGSQEKIVAAGYVQGGAIDLVRYNPNGSLDTSFGTGGKVMASFHGGTFSGPGGMSVQPDGKILVVGAWYPTPNQSNTLDFAVARFNANGSLDSTFGPGKNGLVITDIGSASDSSANAVVVQPDGRIVAGGYHSTSASDDFALVRYNANGTLDTTFGTGGIVIMDLVPGSFNRLNDLALTTVVDASGVSSTKIVAVGDIAYPSSFALARYNLDGSLDTTFGSGGRVITNFGVSQQYLLRMAIQPNGEIVAAGSINNTSDGTRDLALVRYDTAGNLDTTFGPNQNGLVTSNLPGNDFGADLNLQSDGKIIAAGAIMNSSGQDTGTILFRTSPDGIPDPNFGTGGVRTYNFGPGSWVSASVLQSDGKIITAGAIASPTGVHSWAVDRFLNDTTTMALASAGTGSAISPGIPVPPVTAPGIPIPAGPGADVYDQAVASLGVESGRRRSRPLAGTS